jgi:hypothetical protein
VNGTGAAVNTGAGGGGGGAPGAAGTTGGNPSLGGVGGSGKVIIVAVSKFAGVTG